MKAGIFNRRFVTISESTLSNAGPGGAVNGGGAVAAGASCASHRPSSLSLRERARVRGNRVPESVDATSNSRTRNAGCRAGMRALALMVLLILTGVGVPQTRGQTTNDVEELKRQLRQLQENFERVQREQRQQIDALTRKLDELTKPQPAEAERKKLEHNDLLWIAGCDGCGQLVPFHARHFEISNDQVKLARLQRLQRVFGTANRLHQMPVEVQHHLDDVADEQLVIDHEDMSLRKSWLCYWPNGPDR